MLVAGVEAVLPLASVNHWYCSFAARLEVKVMVILLPKHTALPVPTAVVDGDGSLRVVLANVLLGHAGVVVVATQMLV